MIRHIKFMITFRFSFHNDFIGFIFSDIGIEIQMWWSRKDHL